MEAASPTRSFDELIDAVSTVQRRRLLVALVAHNPQVDTPSVVAGEARAAEIERLAEPDHVHLPSLVDCGVIEWDRERDEVTTGEAFGDIRPMVELLADHQEDLPDDWL